MTETIDTQTLIDRAAIHDLHARYYQAIDLSDQAQVRRCFTDDVVAHYHGRPSVRGIDALIESIPAWPKQQSGEWKISTHFMGNLVYKHVGRDAAETEVNAFAFLVLTDQPPDYLAMRSLRYLDRLVKAGGEWRIRERLHTLDWACQVPTTFAIPLAQRKNTIPTMMSGI